MLLMANPSVRFSLQCTVALNQCLMLPWLLLACIMGTGWLMPCPQTPLMLRPLKKINLAAKKNICGEGKFLGYFVPTAELARCWNAWLCQHLQ